MTEESTDMTTEAAAVVTCPSCGEVAAPRARYCEACGTSLAPASDGVPAVLGGTGVPGVPAGPAEPVGAVLDLDPDSGEVPAARPCAACGGRVAEDGYCEECGTPAALERDHFEEQPAPWVAGVCDRGVRHVRNEDAMALAAPEDAGRRFAVLVVCDGVSSAPDSDIASLAASRAARDVLAGYGPAGDRSVEGTVTQRIAGWTDALVASSRAAGQAVVEAAEQIAAEQIAAEQIAAEAGGDPVREPPSCTFATAVVDGDLVVAGWIGDSRVYWLADSGHAEQLSVDDSWAQEMIAAGVPRTQAENAPQAHAITRWLGPDAPDSDAHCAATVPAGAGWLLVCSDGLWNYCSAADDMFDLVTRFAGESDGDPLATSAALVRWANDQGGRDNITAALARLAPLG
ncbi:protein phosphatase 2C domain-containing protein [Antribacter sp. KLBMP9083]|uniref:Protein phosphatase 2C domain-containing protein n=1 Tax=Antribacter soli TaxID=2910976 RepID=A0AA41QCQ3_9MICO|nr:PP2C family serine/threonine-protein phosphatase [Antribacter soli]MCF4119739.1 protein phosphatase 2C domain-containing protein [Antribacter soli]